MIQSLEQLKKEWRELLSNNRWVELFDSMQRWVNGQSDAGQHLYLLRSRYNKIDQDEMKGVVSVDNARLEYNQIRESMLKLIRDLRPEDLVDDGSAAEHTPGATLPSPEQPRRLQGDVSGELSTLERRGYEQQLQLATQKLQRLETALLLETDPARQFAYEHEIQKLKTVVADLKTKLYP